MMRQMMINNSEKYVILEDLKNDDPWLGDQEMFLPWKFDARELDLPSR